MSQSSRSTPEPRVDLRNEALRIDFDPRTSDTMYNYIHLRRPDTSQWERVHNFGIDVRGYRTGDGEMINTIGMNLRLRQEPDAMRVTYPDPLIEYRQFDDKIGTPEMVREYPDFTDEQLKGLKGAGGSLEFLYQIDPVKPSFVISGKVLHGRIYNIVYILSALWTDNHALPTHQMVEGFPEFDFARPEAALWRDVEIENIAYVIFYRHDGNGVPFALLPQTPVKAGICNYYDNWKCLDDFRTCSLNQQYVPEDPAVHGSNDTGYIVPPREDGTFPAVRVAFFPELGWLRGGLGIELRERIVDATRGQYLDAARSWGAKSLPASSLKTFRWPSR